MVWRCEKLIFGGGWVGGRDYIRYKCLMIKKMKLVMQFMYMCYMFHFLQKANT